MNGVCMGAFPQPSGVLNGWFSPTFGGTENFGFSIIDVAMMVELKQQLMVEKGYYQLR